MTEADVTCVVCRSPDTVGPSKLYCGDCEPVGHRDERSDPVAVEYDAARVQAYAERLRCEALAHAEAFRRSMERVTEAINSYGATFTDLLSDLDPPDGEARKPSYTTLNPSEPRNARRRRPPRNLGA